MLASPNRFTCSFYVDIQVTWEQLEQLGLTDLLDSLDLGEIKDKLDRLDQAVCKYLYIDMSSGLI